MNRQMVVAYNAFHMQILHTDGAHLAVVRKCIGDFVEGVLTLVGYAFLQTGNLYASLVSIGRTFLSTAQTLLQQSKTIQTFAQVLGIVKCPSVRAYCQSLNSKVYANGRIVFDRRFRFFLYVCVNKD